MINIATKQKNAFNSISLIHFSNKNKKSLISVVKNVLIILLFLVSSMGPVLDIMATQNSNNNNSSKDNSKLVNKNQISPIQKNSLQHSQRGQTSSTKNWNLDSSQSNSNNNNDHKSNMNSANIQTPAGTPSTNNVNVNETADITQTNSGVSTANKYTSLANATSYTYTKPSGYTNTSNTFDVSSITATAGVYNIENAAGTTFQFAPAYSTQDKNYTLRTISSSFNISVPKVNITQFRSYFQFTNFGDLNLNVSIVNATVGGQPNTASILGSMNYVPSLSGWNNFTFTTPVTLSKGSYFLVINDTSSAICLASQGCSGLSSVNYGFVLDSVNGDQSKVMKTCDLGCSGWSLLSIDIGLQYKYLILNNTDSSLPHVYSSPLQVNMQNNGRSVNSLTSNYFNYTNPTMQFTTNVSVTFNVVMHSTVRKITSLPNVISYAIINNTYAYWNVSFTSEKLSPSGYTVSSRTFELYNLATNWNAYDVVQNGTSVNSLPFNASVTYSNGTSTFMYNSSTDLNPHNWVVSFQGSNYVSAVTMDTASQIPVLSPYLVNSSDTLTVSATLLNSEPGANGTLYLYDYNGILINSSTNVVSTSGTLNFGSILLSSYINNNNPNGTYTLAIEWLDSATQTKLGYYERSFSIISQTSAQFPASIPDTVESQSFSLSVAYSNSLNSTEVNGATVFVTTSWPSAGFTLTNINHDNYTGSISTSGAAVGPNSILITASLSNYVTRSANITFNVVYDTSLTVTPNATAVPYSSGVLLSINYYSISGSANISSATVKVNGSTATEDPTYHFYTYSYNTSQLPNPSVNSFNFVITATKTDYLSKQNTTVIGLLLTSTSVINYDGLSNNTIVNKNYAFNNADLLTYHFSYNDTDHNNLLSTSTLVSNYSISDFVVTGLGAQASTTATVTLDPQHTGNVSVSFTFSKPGYKSAMFAIKFVIQQTPTQLLIGGSTAWTNTTTYSNFIFDYGSRDTFTLNLTLKDLTYNQIITPAGLTSSGNTSSVTIYQTQNATGSWNIAVNPEQQTSFVLTFTLSLNGYAYKTLQITVDMQPIPTNVIGGTYGSTWTNTSTPIQTIYQNGQLDNYTFTFIYNDTYWNELVNNSNVLVTSNAGTNLQIGNITYSGNATWVYQINPINTGTYTVTLTFYHTGYKSVTVTLVLAILKANIKFVNQLNTIYSNFTTNVDFNSNALDNTSYTFIIQNNLYSTNITTLTVFLDASSNATNVQSSYNMGQSYFTSYFDPNSINTFTIVYKISPTTNYYGYIITIKVVVHVTPTQVINSSKNAYNPSETNSSIYYNGALDQLTLDMSFIDANRSSLPSTALLLTNGQLAITASGNNTGYILLLTNNSASYWTININPLQVGTFVITFTFSQTGYATTIITLTITVKNNTFTIHYTNGTAWTNGTSYSKFYNQGTKDNATTYLTIKDGSYSVNATDALLSASSTANYNIFLTNLGNGMWNISINPQNSGTFNIYITVSQTGYNNSIIHLIVVVSVTTATPIYGTINYINSTVPVTKPLGNQTTYSQIYTQTNGDAFVFYITSNDSYYNEAIMSNLAYNTSTYLYTITALSLGNGTWNITLDPNNVGYGNLVLTLYHVGYSNVTLLLTFNITRAKLIVAFNKNPSQIQNATFGSNYSILISITNNFDYSTVSGVSLINTNATSFYFTLLQNPNGTYTLTYYGSRVYFTDYDYVNITLFNSNFVSNTSFWTFVINPPTTQLSTAVTAPSNSFSTEWNTNSTFEMTWYDPNTGFRLNVTSTYVTNNATVSGPVSVFLVSAGVNGNYTYYIRANTVGTFYVLFTFTVDPALQPYFGNSSYIITVIGSKRTTATITPINTNTDYTNNTLVTLYYSRTQDIEIAWFDNQTGFVTLSSASISNSAWIVYKDTNNNRLVFTINGHLVGTQTVVLTLHSLKYTDILVVIKIQANILPTNSVSPNNNKTFTYTEGLYYPALTNTSKLGYTLGANLNWTVADNNSQMVSYGLALYRNNTLITSGTSGYTLSVARSPWTSTIRLVFLPSFNYTKGWYNFTIKLTKYGFENQTFSFLVYIKGFSLKVVLNCNNQACSQPSNLIRGQQFTITAIVTYDNGTTVTNTSALAFFKLMGASSLSQSLGQAVNSINVNFLVKMTITDSKGNDITKTINQTIPTNSNGQSILIINGSDTQNLVKIQSITVSIPGQDVSESANMVITPTINIENASNIPIEYVAGAFILGLVLVIVLLLFFRRRSNRKKAKRERLQGYADKRLAITDTYAMILATKDGLPIYTNINSSYQNTKVSELISGLGSSIDTFLNTFETDLQTSIGLDTKKQSKKVSISSIKKDTFYEFILTTASYKGLIFLKKDPSKFLTNIFEQSLEEIQDHVVVDVIFDEDEVHREVETVLNKRLPLVLFDLFRINAQKLDDLSKKKQNYVTDTTISALKRVFVILMGTALPSDSEGKQLNEFNKIIRKYGAFANTDEHSDTLSSPVYYDNLYKLLSDIIKLETRYIVEALWYLPLYFPEVFVKEERPLT